MSKIINRSLNIPFVDNPQKNNYRNNIIFNDELVLGYAFII